jgi:hypothetical protein
MGQSAISILAGSTGRHGRHHGKFNAMLLSFSFFFFMLALVLDVA